jgi:hypothetical protein
MTNVWVKSTIILSVLANNFLYLFQNKIIYNFMTFLVTVQKMVGQKLFPQYSFVAAVGSGIQDRNTVYWERLFDF